VFYVNVNEVSQRFNALSVGIDINGELLDTILYTNNLVDIAVNEKEN